MTPTNKILLALSLLLLVGCENEFDRCTSGTWSYLSVLEKEMASEGIRSYEKVNGSICHKNICKPGNVSFLIAQKKKMIADGITDYQIKDPAICYDNSQYFEMTRCIARMNQYYDKARVTLDSSDQKMRTIEYLKMHARKFKIRKYKDNKEELFVYSSSMEHFEKTRRVLTCLAESDEC